MKLLLINCNFKGMVLVPSLGLGFIGTYVKKHSNCEVEIVEPLLQGLKEAEVLDKVKKYDYIGLTCYTESRFEVFDFSYKAKKLNPDCKLIVGGPHAKALDKAILEHCPYIDIVVRGEGEETTLDIINGKAFEEISGITWRNKRGEIVRNPDRPMVRDIDSLSYDYSLVHSYLDGWKDLEIPYDLQKLNALPIIASRGCPFRCAFCAAHEQWGKIYRSLSPEELVKRLKELVERYNIGYFRFYDALFTENDKRILEFCGLLEKAKLNISFRIDIRVGTSRKVLERLRKCGCDVVGFGVESGSDRILKRVNKGISREKIEETIKICKELDYWMLGFFMVSLPDETMEDFRGTLELFEFFDKINLQFFKIHPNTSFYNELKQKGEIDDEVWFVPNKGVDTIYGNEIYYCKDIFPAATFYREEAEALIFRVNNSPKKAIQRHGLAKGVLLLPLFAILDVLLRVKMGRKLWNKLKGSNNLKILYKWFSERCAQNRN
jgi:anaerobic magnesium-protoporphyrin IX monomethyl ester cyclase